MTKVYKVKQGEISPPALLKFGAFWVKLDTPDGFHYGLYRSVATGEVIRWAPWRLEELKDG